MSEQEKKRQRNYYLLNAETNQKNFGNNWNFNQETLVISDFFYFREV